jgi:predicted membrane channel-forming protein YqfA (hemolysin III family)
MEQWLALLAGGLVDSTWLVAAAVLGGLGLVLVLAGVVALLRLHPFRFVWRLLAGVVALLTGALLFARRSLRKRERMNARGEIIAA